MVKVKVTKERKRLHYVTLKVAKQVLGPCTPVTPEIVTKAIARNAELLRQEQVRKVNAEAKNGLESFIIDTRDKMSEEAIETVSTETERDAIRTKFDEVEEWLYEDGRALDAKAYQAKTKELSGMTSPIFSRASELEARPKAAEQAREAVNWTMTILETWAAERPEITEEERTKVSGMCANFTEWLDAAEASQAALTPTDPPAFMSSEVTAKLDPIESEVRRLIKKPKPKPKKVKANATDTNSSTVNATDTNSSSTNSSSGGDEEMPSHDEL